MEKGNILNILKQTFQQSLPRQDRRTTLPHLEFVVGLVFCFIGDAKSSSLEAMRRFMMAMFGIHRCKGAFWERFYANETMVKRRPGMTRLHGGSNQPSL